VEFTGLKTKDELVPMVREADILIFSFMTDNRLLERANPHKVLEYLSTGNVIMGSWTLEYAPHQHLLMMAPDRSGFVPTFRRTVERFAELNTPNGSLLLRNEPPIGCWNGSPGSLRSMAARPDRPPLCPCERSTAEWP
jgi:hypothetical protein